MEFTPNMFMFIVALVSVINGLGIVRIIGGLGEYLNLRNSMDISFYGVHSVLLVFQLLTHVLLWWSLIGLRDAVRWHCGPDVSIIPIASHGNRS